MQIGRGAKWLVIKAAEVIGGVLFLAAPTQAVWRRWPAARTPLPQATTAAVRFAVVAHVYYPELLAEIIACWQHVCRVTGRPVPLYITTTDTRAAAVAARLAGLAAVQLHVGPNRGRDIAPFIGLLNAGTLDRYDAVLKLHTKRSPHLWTGNLRRRLLFTLLAGSPRQVGYVERLFRDPAVGIAGWRLSFRNRPSWWMHNLDRVAALAPRMRPAAVPACGFFDGSMFWCRPAALTALRSLALTVDDFEPEGGQTDGALHHAIERMFTLAAWAGGYRVCGLSGTELRPAVPGLAASELAPDRARRA